MFCIQETGVAGRVLGCLPAEGARTQPFSAKRRNKIEQKGTKRNKKENERTAAKVCVHSQPRPAAAPPQPTHRPLPPIHRRQMIPVKERSCIPDLSGHRTQAVVRE